MRETPFSLQNPALQNPASPPFAAMAHEALVLHGFGVGTPPEALTCQIPPDIAVGIVTSDHARERFRALVRDPA